MLHSSLDDLVCTIFERSSTFHQIRHFHYYYFAFAFVIAPHCSAISSRLLTVPWTCKERRPALRGVGSSWRRKTLKNFMNKDRNCKQIFLLHQEKGTTFLQRIKSFGQKMSRTWGSFTLTLFHKKMQISILVKISLGQNPFECTNLILNHHTAGVTSLGNALIWNVMYLRDILVFVLLLYNLWVNSLDFAFYQSEYSMSICCWRVFSFLGQL